MPNTENDNLVEPASIRVYIANLGKYNEGELVGAWLDLPQSREKIDEFLRDTVGLTLDSEEAYAKGLRGERVYEEYAIHDFEFPQDMNGFTPNISEYASLDKVNVLACLIEQADEDCLEVVEAYEQNIAKLHIDEQISMLGHFVALGKEHGFELERDEDSYYYCRTFRPEEGKDINTIVAYDTEKQQWKAYTVDFNQPPDPRIGEAVYRSDAAGAFAMGNSLYAEICEMADVLSDAPERFRAAETLDKSFMYGFERNGEGSFVKQFEVVDPSTPQITASYETEVSWDDEQKQWEVCTTNLDTGKTMDVLWEAEIKDALKEANDQVREVADGSFFRDRTLQQRREIEEISSPRKCMSNRAASVSELAARGREKADQRNGQLQNDRILNTHKRCR